MPKLDLLLLGLYILLSLAAVFFFRKGEKWKGLLITTLLFYTFLTGLQVVYIFFFIVVVYGLGFYVKKFPALAWLPVVLVLLPLVIFKVSDSGLHLLQDVARTNLVTIDERNRTLFRVIGLSYITFNGMSYLLDIKRRYLEPEKNLGLVILYLLYFPCAVSGPLHRAKYLMEQFRQAAVSDENISRGLRLILFGSFKQLVIAQRCFWLLNQFLESGIGGVYYLFAGLLFFLYLYLNFSSFIDIMQGISQIFNVELKDNFRNRIYLAFSRQDFWGGWHITLNEWFRDYFFFPLAKKDRKRQFTNLILLATFLLIALWHGVTKVFLVWGLLNATWIILEKKVNLQRLPYPKFRKVAGVVYHLGFASVLALVFITPDMSVMLNRLITSTGAFPVSFLKQNVNAILVIVVGFLVMDYHYAKAGKKRIDEYLGSKSRTVRWLLYLKFSLLIISLGLVDGISNYYTQF